MYLDSTKYFLEASVAECALIGDLDRSTAPVFHITQGPQTDLCGTSSANSDRRGLTASRTDVNIRTGSHRLPERRQILRYQHAQKQESVQRGTYPGRDQGMFYQTSGLMGTFAHVFTGVGVHFSHEADLLDRQPWDSTSQPQRQSAGYPAERSRSS